MVPEGTSDTIPVVESVNTPDPGKGVMGNIQKTTVDVNRLREEDDVINAKNKYHSGMQKVDLLSNLF